MTRPIDRQITIRAEDSEHDNNAPTPSEDAPRITERPRPLPSDPHQQGDGASPVRRGHADKWKKIERAPTVGPM